MHQCYLEGHGIRTPCAVLHAAPRAILETVTTVLSFFAQFSMLHGVHYAFLGKIELTTAEALLSNH